MNGELFNRAMSNAIFWQNMCCELVEIIELFCEDADAAINTKVVQPSQAGDAQDAARYRWLRSTTNWASNSNNERIDVRNSPELWDAAIDAAINAKGAV